jgi:hypothetical protein
MAGVGGRWQRYAGGGAILLFTILLLVRLEIPGKLINGSTVAIAVPDLSNPAEETWMNITQGGRKIGYAQRTYKRVDAGFRFSENIFMRINSIGSVQSLTVRTTAALKPDRTLSSFKFDLASALFKFTARGEVAGNLLTVHTGAGSEEAVTVISLSEAPYLGGGILESVGAGGLKPGEGKIYHLFDPASLGQREVRITLLGEEEIMIMGESRRARKLSVDFMGMKQVAWVGQDGAVLREDGILGIVLERVAKDQALAGLGEAASDDLTELAAIPSSQTIEKPETLKTLKIRVNNLPKVAFLLDGGRQSYQNSLLTVHRESLSRGAIQSGGAAGDLSALLSSTPFIQSDHQKIREKMREIIAPGDKEMVKAEKIVAWVHKNLDKKPVLSVPNALETLENRVGDCNEHAVLLAALARAAGIPAEIETGLVYLRGRFYYHAWNILFLRDWGGWMTADAVLGQMPADVTHIRFIRGGADRQLDLVGMIGRVSLDILEMER